MKLKYLNIFILIIDILFILNFNYSIFLSFNLTDAGAIGIIGGADGPTAIYITGKLLTSIPYILIVVVNIAVITLNIVKKLKK